MIKSKEFKSLTYKTIIAIIILFFVSLSFSVGSTNLYKKYIIKNNAKIVGNLINALPNEEEKIINEIKSNEGNIEFGKHLLDKYGIDEDNLYLIKPNQDFKNQLLIWNIIGTSICLIVIVIIYFRHLKEMYRKMDNINSYINEVLNERYNFKIKEYEEGMFSTLKNDVYKITNKLKEQSESLSKDKKYLEETLSDISHQLKTPLTSMYVINDLLYDDKIDKKLKKEFLDKNKAQLERIEWLVTSLLKLSKLESGTIKLKTDRINVLKLINSALEPLKIPIELKNQNVDIVCDRNITIIADFNWTLESLLNIIKNAHEHTKENGNIKIQAEDNPLYVTIKITDNGEGIDEEDINHIFERFYKGKSNNKDSIGIGLNMAKQVITRQNGEIKVESKKNIGTSFTIKFYKSNI